MAGFADRAKNILASGYETIAQAFPSRKSEEKRIQTFEEFYPFYLSALHCFTPSSAALWHGANDPDTGQHENDTSRRLHIVGTSAAMALLAIAAARGSGKTLIAVPLVGYGLAWVGHFFFEKNKPATFKYPLFSLRADLQLCYEVYTGKRAF